MFSKCSFTWYKSYSVLTAPVQCSGFSPYLVLVDPNCPLFWPAVWLVIQSLVYKLQVCFSHKVPVKCWKPHIRADLAFMLTAADGHAPPSYSDTCFSADPVEHSKAHMKHISACSAHGARGGQELVATCSDKRRACGFYVYVEPVDLI